jgi:hypothetical protein
MTQVQDIFKDAAGWLADQRAKFASQVVTYRQGDKSVQLPAALGSTRFEVESSTGVIESVESRDFIIRRADLAVGGVALLPLEGDTILLAQGDGTTGTYQVLLPPGREQAWSFSDRHETSIRVHTKQVAQAAQ